MSTGFDPILNPPLTLLGPAEQRVPFVFSSPHSGRNYPPEFLAAVRLSRRAIRRSEDFRVDELFAGVAAIGCPLLSANFPRAFVDVNREPFELDPAMFREPLPGWCNTLSPRVAGGLGTIARIVSETEEIYLRKLTLAEALERIEMLYRPWHAALAGLMERTRDRFGFAVLVDCHSMPSAGESGHKARPHIVLGDRHGESCAPAVTRHAAEILADLGYRVEINKPYAGGFITGHYGRPAQGWHALQIELNRSLYMDEIALEKGPGFARVAADMREFAARFVSIPDRGLAPAFRQAAE
jgi:N-formylglutamate amidohydrolase